MVYIIAWPIPEGYFFPPKHLTKMKSETHHELDPSKRFEKHEELLGAKRRISCFKAYDRVSGLEVTWNEINVSQLSKQQRDIVFQNLERVKKLRHSSILMVIHSWYDETNNYICFITESICYDSIETKMISNVITPRPKVIAKWAHSILSALHFLHTQDPPFIHNGISLDSTYLKPASGLIKIIPPEINPYIMDFRSTSLMIRPSTAPEKFFGSRTPASDIWSLGVLLVQASTSQYPYMECTSPYAFYEQIRNFQPPKAISQISDKLLQNLILFCLLPTESRWTAAQLLNHSFFSQEYDTRTNQQRSSEEIVVIIPNKSPTQSFDRVKIEEPSYVSASTPLLGSKGK